MLAAQTESLLTQAGFRARRPETAKQKEIYAKLPAYKIHRAVVDGKVFYVFKNTKKGTAYVGHETEYQHYRQLATKQRMAEDEAIAAEMDRQTAQRWQREFMIPPRLR